MRLFLPLVLFIAYNFLIHHPGGSAISPQQLSIFNGFGSSQAVYSSHFPFGVASGDPLPDGFIIWTMLDTAVVKEGDLVEWQVSLTNSFDSIVNSGSVNVEAKHHFRVKVDVEQLESDNYYFYRFRHEHQWSPVGRSRTAPARNTNTEVNLAFVSCNSYEWGYFNAFENIATREDLHAVVHLGDYIYEYASGDYGDTTIGRIHEPRHEVITAEDYYQRYAQYRRDPQLRAAHAAHPFICIWDDHEVANNSSLEGAENHNVGEGDYLVRMTAARQIYYDWMPVRESADRRLYRSIQFGRNVDLHMLDERLAGRTAPADSFDPAVLADSCRRMLGEDQFEWLCTSLRNSPSRWQLLGNQVLFADLDLSDILPQYAVNVDAWDGYRYEKDRLIDSIKINEWENIVFLTGDTHCSWYFNVTDDLASFEESPTAHSIAHEFGTPGVSSANYDEFIQGWDTLMVARYRLFRDNPHLEYANLKDHGYLLLRLNADELRAEFHFSQTVRRRTCRERPVKTFSLPYVNSFAR
ncbi:MAG: alkaline phosphatase D family protein [Bacteroidota bacterium]